MYTAVFHLKGFVGNTVEKITVVGNYDCGAREGHEIFLEPFDRFYIEVVCRLV